jgi:Ca2+/H+ antiporter, TMEM165/GDT1 family
MSRFRFLRAVKVVAIAALAVAAFGYAVMQLWNWAVPAVTGLHSVTFAQALALLVLARILFGGFRARGGGWHWRHRLRERWEQMTPEQREQFQGFVGSRFGCRTERSSPRPASE